MANGINNLRRFGKFKLDPEKKVLWYKNEPVNLTLKEIELLCVLTESNELITKDEIINQVWADSFVEESNLSRNIYRLRKTLAKYGESEEIIETVPKRGYRWTGEIIFPESSQEIIIEKHSITRTIIEEIETIPNQNLLPPKPSVNRYLLSLLSLFVILVLIGGYFFYKSSLSTDLNSIKSVAVLPLKGYQQNQDQTLPIRIADAVITRLGSSDKIIVRPTSAVSSFIDDERDVIAIGKKLQTDAVLDGRIQQENDKLRITLQLINVADGKQIWSGQIDGIATQILILQDEISHKVLQVVDKNYQKETEITATLTKNSEAYEAYLQGRYYMSQLNSEGLNKAKVYFNSAINLDWNFAEAHIGLASAEWYLFDHGWIDDKKQVDKAKSSLQTALSLKPDLVEANTLLGAIQWIYDWDWKKAENTLKKAVEISPNNSNARNSYGVLLNRLGRYEEADVQIRKAVELNPTYLMGNVYIGVNYFSQKDYESAIKQFQKVIEINPKFIAGHWWLSRALWLSGKKQEAIQEIISALEHSDETERKISRKLKENLGNKTPEDVLIQLMTEWKKTPDSTYPHTFAYMNVLLGENQKALDWLEKSYDEHHPWTTWIKSVPEFQLLKYEPRYQELLRKMNF
jgi:DNA-binding winged helix-turn-helix (wHTH) protein/TolB-like protein/lipoprotein NlpI